MQVDWKCRKMGKFLIFRYGIGRHKGGNSGDTFPLAPLSEILSISHNKGDNRGEIQDIVYKYVIEYSKVMLFDVNVFSPNDIDI